MKKYIGKIYILIFTFGLFQSCSEEKITKFPVTALSEDAFWTSEDEVRQAANALYGSLPNVGQIEWDALTEIMFSQNGPSVEISTGGINPGSSLVNNLWTGQYATIRDVNWFMENVEKAGLSEADLAHYMGQVRFFRAWAHYKLLYQFGSIPLVDRVLGVNEGQVEPSSRATVLNFVLSELDIAIDELSSSEYSPEYGRITKWAVMALKSRILLYEGTLASDNSMLVESAELAQQIINGPFSLHDNYTELFRPEGERSSEIILARVNADLPNGYHSLGQWLGPISFHASWSIYTPTMALVERYPDINGEDISISALYDSEKPFEHRDPRLRQTIFNWMEEVEYEGAMFENNGTWLNFRKWIDPAETAEQRSHNDFIVFRLGEVYLNYVEAMNEINGPSQDLLDLINKLRARGGKGAASDGSDIIVPPIALADLTKDSFREIIRRERIIELAAEGMLYYDYHRWNLLDETMNQPAIGIVPLEDRTFTSPRDYTWPIPDFELINNSNLKQNPGY
ncbi:RagB/SusD family nutrient uptake outer membrane protein [Antarcticibacterium sp. 1MA-6-2]|uniref:RagB/SusD family nutrient uptake outer membrane protein n=1 Tax=Antarcticibacterium sp. 1MA-6-2 TaxID=2908210 RepID=UPI001F2271E7|nr:RagB/SusD family nutrient uptake outer membrane protein [Antarcticibacterium sp. 1MA-6-2]UJH92692.1 RagB/SusD family nutrient uptake outer membrane protein [Antarcticibacterium sp. 1MA-6-2]